MAASHQHPFHVLREYALVADGYRGALLGPDGGVAWLCFPTWDAPALFAGLIGSGGEWMVQPCEPFVWGGYYEDASLIWRNRWVTHAGVVECREALARPSHADRAVVLRQVTARSGCHRVRSLLRPRGDYGRCRLGRWRERDGEWLLRGGDIDIRLAGAPVWARDADSDGLVAEFTVEPGRPVDLVLEVRARDREGAPLAPAVAWEETETVWRETAPEAADVIGRRDVRHAWAVLAGLSRPDGGTVAAVTTSLPERADRGGSYDYRYVWIRDLAYIGEAAAALGDEGMVRGSTRFVTERLLADGPNLCPAYTAGGGRIPGERGLDLPGYPGGMDVVGNHVRDQFQLDVFGEALILLSVADDMGVLDADGWVAVEEAAKAIAARWEEPDAGVWELGPGRWTHSRLVAAAGLRAVARRPAAGSNAPVWLARADAITAEVSRTSLHRTGRWQRSPEDDRVDASLLLASLRGAIGADDPRTRATLAAVSAELTDDGYVYRFRADEQPLGHAEGAFLLCGFWVSQAVYQAGDVCSALRWFERTRAACGPPGLYSEEFDVGERQLRGNLPQAFVHGELIRTAVLLSEERR